MGCEEVECVGQQGDPGDKGGLLLLVPSLHLLPRLLATPGNAVDTQLGLPRCKLE